MQRKGARVNFWSRPPQISERSTSMWGGSDKDDYVVGSGRSKWARTDGEEDAYNSVGT